MLDCAIIRDLLPQYHHNTLSSASRAAIEEHALTCPVCAGLLEEQNAISPPVSRKPQYRGFLLAVLLFILLLALFAGRRLQSNGSDLLRCPDTGWSASVQQQDDAFTIQILKNGTRVNTITSPGTYESALWCPGGGFLAVAYRKDDHSYAMIYRTDSRDLRHLDQTFTQTLRYQNSAFSFLSGNTSAWEGMDYIPWVWSRDGYRILIYGKGTAADGWSYTGYFWYTPYDGTVSDVTGFDSRFIEGNPMDPP